MNDAQTTATGFLQHKPVYSIELTRQEYYLIQRLRRLFGQQRQMLLVEVNDKSLRWRKVGKVEE